MLVFETREPRTASDDAPLIVLMHGRGATRFDLLSLADYMPADARVVFPEAPFSGAQWGYGGGSAWYRFLGRNKPEPESFAKTLDEVQQFIGAFNAPRIVVGGFSQGGTVGLAYALAHPQSVAGVLNFSGFLADHPRVVPTVQNVADTKFFWGHGRQDTSIPFDLAVEGRAVLSELGADLEAHDYDIGHWIDAQELNDAVEWLTPVLRK